MSTAEAEGILAPAVLKLLLTKELKHTQDVNGDLIASPWAEFRTSNDILKYCYDKKINLLKCASGIDPTNWKNRGKGTYVIYIFLLFLINKIIH